MEGEICSMRTGGGLGEIKRSGENFKFVMGRVDWGAITFIQRFLSSFPGDNDCRWRNLLSNTLRASAQQVFGLTGSVSADHEECRVLISFGDAHWIPAPSDAVGKADRGRKDQWSLSQGRGICTSRQVRADLWVPVIPEDLSLALGIMRSLLDRYAW
jgi:hypothetical protein